MTWTLRGFSLRSAFLIDGNWGKQRKEKRMTRAEKKLIDLYRRQGMGSTEIAEKLSLSVNTVKSYCRRNTIETAVADANAAPSGLCKQCGKLISGKPDKRGKQFCSDRCRYQWWHLHRGESINATEHTCLFCGRVFKTNRQQKYCCHSCYIMARFGGQERYEADKGTI